MEPSVKPLFLRGGVLFSRLTFVAFLQFASRLEKNDEIGDIICLDWFNGRRYPTINDNIRSAMIGLSLATDAPKFYRSLICAAVMGAKRLFNGYLAKEIPIQRVIAVGGIAQKSPYTMQMMADALDRTVSVSKSYQTCALGAAMYASVAAGIWSNLSVAQSKMRAGIMRKYEPDHKRTELLNDYYKTYCNFGEKVDDWYA